MKQDHSYDGVFFTLGKLSFYQFNEFYKIAGINGLRLFQYIRTKRQRRKMVWFTSIAKMGSNKEARRGK